MIIRNWNELTSKGNLRGREIVLKTIEQALQDVNSFNLVKRQIAIRRDELRIGRFKYDLTKTGDIFVVGGGKQVTFVASALEELLGSRIREGVVVEKKGWGCSTKFIRVIKGGHPIPDAESIEGGREIVRIVEKAKADDLVIVCVTGGCTALTMLPPETIALEDARSICQDILDSGAPVEKINAIRNHLSRVGGGKLALLARSAELVSLIAIDEVAGMPWGPTVPDATTFADARRVLVQYNLWDKAPKTVKSYFERADMSQETPKEIDFEHRGVKSKHVVFAENRMVCGAAERKATELGTNALTLSTCVEGEAKDVGVVLASIAKEIENSGKPFKPPCVLVAGGETTVTIAHKKGEGGRNQELALATALRISGSERIVAASIGTDGTDGPTDIAGGIVDGYSLRESRRVGLDAEELLMNHNSSRMFRTLNDAIYTTDTATNLMDLMVIYVA